jgi:hypothetical protein
MLVPKSAVLRADGHDVVMVIRAGRAERRAVTVKSATEDEATLSAGVAAGERVIVDPPKELPDGGAVKELNP